MKGGRKNKHKFKKRKQEKISKYGEKDKLDQERHIVTKREKKEMNREKKNSKE